MVRPLLALGLVLFFYPVGPCGPVGPLLAQSGAQSGAQRGAQRGAQSGDQRGAPRGQSLAPYVPTPEDVVDRMLVLAGTTKDDIVYDLGCGDGRIPIAAARTYGARGVGIDIDPKRIEESRANAKAAGVEHLVEFRLGDALAADVSPATVVTLYMLGSGNAALRPVLTRQLRPGARIVSHAFSMGPTWPADTVDHFTSARGDEVTLYFWKADGKVRP